MNMMTAISKDPALEIGRLNDAHWLQYPEARTVEDEERLAPAQKQWEVELKNLDVQLADAKAITLKGLAAKLMRVHRETMLDALQDKMLVDVIEALQNWATPPAPAAKQSTRLAIYNDEVHYAGTCKISDAAALVELIGTAAEDLQHRFGIEEWLKSSLRSVNVAAKLTGELLDEGLSLVDDAIDVSVK